MNSQPIILIAIADDHPATRAGLKGFIEIMDFGCNVFIEAGDGKELLEKIAASTCQPDICFIDISMDGMDGFETVLQLKEKYPLIQCIAISFSEDEYHILNMMKNGAKGYVSKKTNAEGLKAAILKVKNGGIYFSADLLEKYPKLGKIEIEKLTTHLFNEKERQFLELCCSELTYAQIADKMNISSRTAEKYATRLCERLNLNTREGLSMYSQQAGIGKNFRQLYHFTLMNKIKIFYVSSF